MSWGIRDLDSDARERAVAAANRAGMSVDEWLNSLILNQGQKPGRPSREAAVARSRDHDELHERVERLRGTSAPAPRNGDADNVEEIARALGRLLNDGDKNGRAASEPREARRPRAERKPAGPAPESRRREPVQDERSERVERVLSALGKLDERVRSLSKRNGEDDGRSAPRRHPEARVADDRATVSGGAAGSLQDAIDEIEARRDTLRNAREARERGYETPRREPSREQRQRPASRETRAQVSAPAQSHAQASNGVDFEHHFRDLADRIDSLRAPRDDAFADLRQEIVGLRRSIERRERDGTSERDLRDITRLIGSVERMQREAHDPHLADELRAEIADLRDAVMANNIDGAMKTLESGYAHIVERLDDMRRQMRDPSAFEPLERRLDDIERGLQDIPRASSFTAFDDRLNDMVHRLEGLASHHGDEGLARLEDEMHELRSAIGALDVRDLVHNVDGQLRDMAERMDAMEHGGAGASGIEQRLLAFEDRLPDRSALDALNHRMERISSMLSEDRASSGGMSDRVDERLGEILGRLDRIERQGAGPADFEKMLSMLEGRIESIAGKLGALDGLPLDTGSLEDAIARLDAATDRVGGDRLAELQAQIADIAHSLQEGGHSGHAAEDIRALRSEVGEIRKEIARTEQLASVIEPQIQQLARSLVVGDRLTTDEASLQRIEQQIAVIAGQLDATEDRLSGLSDIEAALSRIDSSIAGGTSGTAASAGNDAAIDALRSDLSKLFEAAQDNRRESDDSMEKVQTVLNDIVARLASLESDAEEEMHGYAEVAVAGGGGRPVSLGRSAPPPRPPLREEPSFHEEPSFIEEDDEDLPDLSTVEDLPLEPGSGKPDLAALLRAQAREGSEESGLGDRKANFIAAARRAAQAAAAEISVDEQEGTTQPKDRGAWLRDRLKRSRSDSKVAPVAPEDALGHAPKKGKAKKAKAEAKTKAQDRRPGKSGSRLRRPLIFAAAAVILTIGALKVATLLESGGDAPAPVAQNNTPAQPQPSARTQAPQQQADASAAAGPRTSAPAPSSTPDKAVTFQPPASEPGSFEAPDTMQPYGKFAKAPPAEGADPATVTSAEGSATPAPNSGATSNKPADAGTPGVDGKDKGLSTPMPDEALGALSLRVAAANGNPRAQFEIALRYTEGQGVPADMAKAAEWYKRAAEGGLAPAQYRIGSFYEKGRGVPQDLEQARSWYQRAADQGNIKAMHNLAVLFADGGLGKPDFERAARWFEKAADHGVRDSQFNLGVLYARGLGVPKNMVNSYKWFAIAARLGDNDAAAKRDEIANALQPAELTEARAAAERWTQKTADDAANHVTPDPSWADKPANAADAGGSLVMQAQLLLNELGFDPGPADGVVGPKTVDAVRSFQLQAGLPVDGSISSELIRALAGRSI